MRRVLSWVGLITFALIPSLPAIAAELAGVQFSDKITVAGKELKLNGLGMRQATLFKVKVYVAGVYLETPTHDGAALMQSKELKQLSLKFVRSVDAKKISNAWKEAFEKNCAKDCSRFQSHLDKFNSFMTDMNPGDDLTLVFFPDRIEVSVKGQPAGTVSGGEFNPVLLATWFGPNPPNESLKEGLLGLGK
jgi:hypothetical protein